MPALPSRSARSRSLVVGVLAASVVAAVLPALPARAVTTNEVYAVPSNGVFAVEGHGWGHGRGLSQYGAQGGAQLGKTADQITGFYYPGTAKTTLANTAMRVRLTTGRTADTQVFPATGLTVTDLATGAKATLPSGPQYWRAHLDSAGLHVQSYSSGAWHAYALGGKTVHTGPVQFGGPTFVRVSYSDGTSRDYRGVIKAVKISSTAVGTVDVLPMESYLQGVVPRESSSSWAAAALQAQAIAARSYSAYKRAHAPSSQYFDICDTTMCQVFGGSATYTSGGTRTNLEPTSTNDAIKATAGVVRTYQGAAIFAEFSASNGGWSTAGSVPYLVAQADSWDGVTGSSVHSWNATVSAAQIQARYPAVGTLRRLRVTERDGNGEWGGRVKAVVLEGVDSAGSATSVTTTGAGIYYAHTWPAATDGLRSSWWHIKASLASSVVSQSTAPRLVRSPGTSTGTLTVSLKNTGTSGWPVSGLHLAVANPAGQADPLVGGSTTPGSYVGNRTNPGASTVAPGDVADFRFALTGDGVDPGTYSRAYRLRIGTGSVFGATVSWTVQVDAPLFAGTIAAPAATPPGTAASSTTGAPPAVFADGRTVVVPVAGSTTVRVSTKNTGNITWPAGSATQVRLGTSVDRGRVSVSAGSDWISSSRPAALGGSTAVAPGGTGTFDLVLHGNGRPVGSTSESFEPLWDGKHWIDGHLTTLTVVRVNPSVSRLAEAALNPPAAVTLTTAPSGSTTLHVRLRNLGGSAWAVGTERLQSSSTTLATSAWASSTTPPALASNVSRPGQTSVYPGEVGQWDVPLSAYKKATGKTTLSLQAKGPSGLYGPVLKTTVTVVAGVFSGSLVSVHGSVTVPRTGTATTWFDVKNTGNVDWPVGGSVRSEVLTPGGSPSQAASWLSAGRPGPVTLNVSSPGGKVVHPGQVARFAIVLAGNNRTPGARSERFGVVWEAWARLAGVTPTLTYYVQ